VRYVPGYGKLPGVAVEDHTAPSGDQTETERRRHTVAEAAEVLGITAEAVRTRIKRGKLESVKEDGTVYVLLEVDPSRPTGPNVDPTVKGRDRTPDQTGVVAEIRDRVAYLERQVEEEREARRRADTIIAQLSRANEELSRTIRAIEAPREEPPESPESPVPSPTPTEAGGGSQEGSQRLWWRRWFGG
jgi:hypothetical protein